MDRQIWDEGRVVGYSAYEIYVKQSQANGVDPVSETEWMSSMLGSGSSLLLKISGKSAWASKATNEVYNIDIPLPSDSKLWSANTIVATFFIGDADWSINAGDGSDSDYKWASAVTSYGPLLDNTAIDHPAAGDIDDNTDLPMANSIDLDADTIQRLKNYIHIYDGIVMQPGEWKTASSTPPAMDFEPDFSKTGWIRLAVRGPITAEGVYILFTGFTIGTILPGMSGIDGSVGTPDPADGDFLGPAVCPWANKLIFSVPTAYIEYFTDISKIYEREIFTGDLPVVVDSQPIIDIASNPYNYYETHYNDSTRDYTITRLDTGYDSSASIFTLCDDDDHLTMPALFVTKASSNTLPPPSSPNAVLYPVDIASPGTVKIFPNYDANSKEQAERYELAHPNTLAFCYNSNTGKIFRNIGGDYHPVASSYTMSSSIVVPQDYRDQISPATTQYCYLAATATGSTESTALSLVDENGTYLPTAPDAQTKTWDLSERAICWQDLLLALDTQVQIDLLGTDNKLRYLKNNFTFDNRNIKFPIMSITSGQCGYPDTYDSSANPTGQARLLMGSNNKPATLYLQATQPYADKIYNKFMKIESVNTVGLSTTTYSVGYDTEGYIRRNGLEVRNSEVSLYTATRTSSTANHGADAWSSSYENPDYPSGSSNANYNRLVMAHGIGFNYNNNYKNSSDHRIYNENDTPGGTHSDGNKHGIPGLYDLQIEINRGTRGVLIRPRESYIDKNGHLYSYDTNTESYLRGKWDILRMSVGGYGRNDIGNPLDDHATDATMVIHVDTKNVLLPYWHLHTPLNDATSTVKIGLWPKTADASTISTKLSGTGYDDQQNITKGSTTYNNVYTYYNDTLEDIETDMTAGFIELANHLRLYLSTSEPLPDTTIPVGSLGIGW